MLKNEIVKSSFFAVLQIIVTSFTYLAIYALVLLRLGKVQLGIYSIITAIPMVVSFLGSGVAGSLLRYIPVYAEQKEPIKINKLITNRLLFNLILGLFMICLRLIFSCIIAGLAIYKFGLIGLLVAQLFQAILVFGIAFLYLHFYGWFSFS